MIAGDSVDYINKTRGNQTRRHQGPIYYIGSTTMYQVPEAVDDRGPDQMVLPSPANWAQKFLPPLAIVLILWWNDMIALSSSGPDQTVLPSPANWAQKFLPPLAIVLILWWHDMIALSSSGGDIWVTFIIISTNTSLKRYAMHVYVYQCSRGDEILQNVVLMVISISYYLIGSFIMSMMWRHHTVQDMSTVLSYPVVGQCVA